MFPIMIKLIIIFWLLFGITEQAKQDKPTKLNIGLIYEEGNSDLEKVFQKAIQDANADLEKIYQKTNQGTDQQKFIFNEVSVNITSGNAFELSKKLCKMLRSGVVAVFGPPSSTTATHAISICDAKEVPYMDTRWDFTTELPTINLHPHPDQLAVALKDIVAGLGWTDFTILYESGDYLVAANELLQMYDNRGPAITVRRYELDLNGNYRNVLRRIKRSDDFSIVILGSTETLPELLLQAQQIGLLTEAYRYVIGNMDFGTIDFEPFQHGGANITSFRMVSPENSQVEEILRSISETAEDPSANYTFPMTHNMAFVYDGVQLLAETFKQLSQNVSVSHMPLFRDHFKGISLNCADDSTWAKGFTLVNFLKTTNLHGLTGEIKFDNQGLRTEFELEVTELTTLGITKIATWSSSGYETQRAAIPTVEDVDTRTLVNKTFIVITALTEPYGMLKNSSEKLSGNDQFEGFGIELIEKLGKKLGFNYIFRLQEDSAYGTLNHQTGEWNGMIREILENRADLAITDLTMTSDRESAVDFTIPFMNLGISILFRRPMKEPPKLFSFMSPFSGEVWLYLGVAYLSVSLSLFVLGRLSPVEWDNPYPCIEEPSELENQFSFANSLWFTVGALLQQGSEIAPKAPSTRTVASMWWFFTLIMVSSYTANLAAFLTVESLSSPIENVEDLANRKGGVHFGAKKGGSTFAFFRDAQYPTYKRMYEYMEAHPEMQPTTNAEGVSRVEKENYAFLMESSSIEYIIERHCTLTQVGSLLDEKGYGIAMRKDWPYRDILSQAILEFQEQGVLAQMKVKWWKEKRGGGACSDTGDDAGAVPLELANLGGVFLVLIVGSFFGLLVSIMEMLVDVRARSVRYKTSFKEEFISELKFIIRCSGNTKEVRQLKSRSESTRSSISLESIESENTNNEKNKDDDQIKLTN